MGRAYRRHGNQEAVDLMIGRHLARQPALLCGDSVLRTLETPESGLLPPYYELRRQHPRRIAFTTSSIPGSVSNSGHTKRLWANKCPRRSASTAYAERRPLLHEVSAPVEKGRARILGHHLVG